MSSTVGMDASKPPFIQIPGVANLRDIGGYPTASSRLVRPGIFYRAADPCAADASSVARLRDELGIATIYDLRAKPEIDRNAGEEGDVPAFEGRLADGSKEDGRGAIQRQWTPVFKEEDYGPDAVAMRFVDYAAEGTEGFVRAYETIAEHGVAAYTPIFKRLASLSPPSSDRKQNQGILIHCTAGKDRTGVFVALLLSLLGVDDQTIAREYTLTEAGLAHQKSQFVERIMLHPAFSGPGGPGREGAVRMTTCTEPKMLDTLKMLRTKYGGPEAYVRNVLGISDDEVEAIRERMTVDAKVAPQPAL